MDDPRELGTLIVVVGKARNLPNKSRFGKQDPFCTVQFLDDKKRTKTIKRGGQHPEWDDELRFTIMEELEDILKTSRSESLADSTVSSSASLASVASRDSPGVTTAQALAAKSRRPLKKGGGKSMRVACYADDPKEPELIGDCHVQIDEVLKKGEVDEWYEFTYKEKYVGEIYLELTFYSNDAPPVNRNAPRPVVHQHPNTNVFQDGQFPSNSSLSGKLSASGSVSGMNLYIPPYAAQHVAQSSFGDLGLPPGHSRQQDFAPTMSSSPASFAPQVPTALAPSPDHPSMASMDALSRPFSSMSIGAPDTPPKSIPPSASTHGLNRHSVGVSDAPWVALLPQSQVSSGSAPHSRPMSTNDALPWERAKQLEDERRRSGATPMPMPGEAINGPLTRPVSGQGFISTPPRPGSSVNIRPGDTVPQALQPGQSPIRHQHAHSFSTYADRPVVTSLLHSSPSPAPGTTVPHASSAPPTLPPAGQATAPLSSFERVALALNTSAQSSPHGQSPLPTMPLTMQDPLQTPVAAYQPTPPRVAQDYPARTSVGTPTRVNPSPYQQLYSHLDSSTTSNSTSPQPAQLSQTSQPHTPHHQPHPQLTSQPPSQPMMSSTYSHAQSYPGSSSGSPATFPDHRPSTTPIPTPPHSFPQPQVPLAQAPPTQPSPPVPHVTSSGSYIPWYQQTQSAAASSSAPPRPNSSTPAPPAPGYQDGFNGPRPAFGPPPPVPSRRPVPTPPGQTGQTGQSGQRVGYYPSDELYIRSMDEVSEVYSAGSGPGSGPGPGITVPPRHGSVSPAPPPRPPSAQPPSMQAQVAQFGASTSPRPQYQTVGHQAYEQQQQQHPSYQAQQYQPYPQQPPPSQSYNAEHGNEGHQGPQPNYGSESQYTQGSSSGNQMPQNSFSPPPVPMNRPGDRSSLPPQPLSTTTPPHQRPQTYYHPHSQSSSPPSNQSIPGQFYHQTYDGTYQQPYQQPQARQAPQDQYQGPQTGYMPQGPGHPRDYARSPSPAPPQPQAQPATTQYHTPPPRHPYTTQARSASPLPPPPRSPSPLPPPPTHPVVQSHQGHHPQSSSASPYTPSQLAPLPPNKSPLVNHDPHRSPSPFPPQSHYQSNQMSEAGTPSKSNWRSYLQNLPTTSSSPDTGYHSHSRTTSGLSGIQTIPSQSQSQSQGYGGAGAISPGGLDSFGQAQGVPGAYPFGSDSDSAASASAPAQVVKPLKPEGWKSTLPAQANGHRWGG